MRCGVVAAVGIRARDSVGASIVDGYSIIGAAGAPRIRARARGRQCGVVALAETIVA